MNRLLMVRSQAKKQRELFHHHQREMNSAKFKLDTVEKELERLEAAFICDECKGPIKEGEPYICDRNKKYCCKECRSTADIKEIDSLNQWESDYQDGKTNLK